MKIQKEHKKETLMRWTKEKLAEHIMRLEHNLNVLNDKFDAQYYNCWRLLDEMKLLNKTYTEAKQIVKETSCFGADMRKESGK